MGVNQIYSALFVDFDNLYLCLRENRGKDAAENFAMQPQRWIEWLEKGLPANHFGGEPACRRILIRKCYLNPGSFGKFRPYFTLAGFEVVDCPKLTQDGKTSTDIHMVMDIMDALNHPSHFDEFILFSADADFTPVLLRVRQHKRYSVVIAGGYCSPAYKAAGDYLPSLDLFLQDALGMKPIDDDDDDEAAEVEKAEMMSATAPDRVLHQMGQILQQRLATNPVVNSYELVGLYKRVDEFCRSSSWLGFGSLRLLTRAIVAKEPGLRIFNDRQYGSWGVESNPAKVDPYAGIAQIIPDLAPTVESRSNGAKPAERSGLRSQIARAIIEKVSQSPGPVIMGNLAEMVRGQFGEELDQYEGWLGATSFIAMLKEMDLNGLKLNNTIPGYVYDPNRHMDAINQLQTAQAVHEAPRYPLADEFKRKYPEIEPLAAKIHQLTDMPYLLPEHYALILTQLARTVNENGFQLTQVTRLVRDRCVERGAPVARAHINFVVIGINYAGHSLSGDEDPRVLAEYLYKNTINLCQSVQMPISEEDDRLIRQWLCEGFGKLPPEEKKTLPEKSEGSDF